MIARISAVIVNGARALAGVALVALMLLFCIDVVARYFFGSPIDGVLEITTTLLLPLVVFVGMALSVPADVHVRMGVIYDRLPGVPRRVLRILALSLGALLWAAIGWQMGNRAIESILEHEVSTVSFALPVFWGFLIVAVGSAAMTIVSILHLFIPEPEHSVDDAAVEGV